ncbi:MAG TPA: hypothetical protein VGI10_14320 [Polyangiaceae bacterium]|jgi:hypothetical protein
MTISREPCFRNVALTLALAGVTAGCLTPPGSPGGPPLEPTGTGASAVGGNDPGVSSAKGGIPYIWKNVTILGGGYVTGNVFSRAEKNLLYARTDVGGAYRWDQPSKTWIAITDQFGRVGNSGGIDSIAADPTDPNKVYAALGTYTQSWADVGDMIRSNDRGSTWAVTKMTIKMGGNEYGRSNGERLAVDPNSPNILFFGSRRNGLWLSTDRSVTWKASSSFPVKDDEKGFGLPFVVFDAKSGAPGKPTPVIYVGVSSPEPGLYRSTDAGASWKLVPNQPRGAAAIPHHLDIDSNGTIYVSYANAVGPGDLTTGTIKKLEPKTDTWTDITPLLADAKKGFGYGGLSVDQQHPGTLIVSTLDRWEEDEVFRTTDGGKKWVPLIASAVRDDQGAKYLYWHKDKMSTPGWDGDVDIDPFDANRATLITGQGTWMTEDLTQADSGKPTHWAFYDKGLEETVVAALISPPAGPPLISGVGDICGFRHDDLDKPSPTGMFDNPLCNGTTGLDYAANAPNIVARVGNRNSEKDTRGALSMDGGATWKMFASEPVGCKGAGSVALSADGKIVMWASRKAAPAFSRDGGATWTTSAGAPQAGDTPDWAPVNVRVASDRVNPNKFYVYDVKEGTAYASTDGGAHFKTTTKGLPGLPDYDLTSGSLETTPGVEGDVWVTTGKELYHSTDSGQNFSGVTVDEGYSLGFGMAKPGFKYPAMYLIGKVGGVYGFYRSDDSGSHWNRINDDAHQFGRASVIIGDPRKYGRVYIGTGGRGILYGDQR